MAEKIPTKRGPKPGSNYATYLAHKTDKITRARVAAEEAQKDMLARAVVSEKFRRERPDLARIIRGFNETMIVLLRRRYTEMQRGE